MTAESPRRGKLAKLVADHILGDIDGYMTAAVMNSDRVANAENNNGMDVENLYVSTAISNPGPTLKRGMPRAQGRYNRILKRTTHITLGVSENA